MGPDEIRSPGSVQVFPEEHFARNFLIQLNQPTVATEDGAKSKERLGFAELLRTEEPICQGRASQIQDQVQFPAVANATFVDLHRTSSLAKRDHSSFCQANRIVIDLARLTYFRAPSKK